MQYIKNEMIDSVLVLTLNRPECLNAWHTDMRTEIIDTIEQAAKNEQVRALIITGAGDRAFSAGQDLNEAHDFDGDRAEEWIGEWERYYDALRSFPKPIVMALNGTAAGSAFQVSLLGDIRVAHPGVKIGQPEINSGIASVTGPWIMREMLGLSRTTELTLTGRMMDAKEGHQIGLIHHLVAQSEVFSKSLEIARELASKPPIAMRMDKARFKEITEASFREAIAAAARIHRECYASGEPAKMMEKFFAQRAAKKSNPQSV